MSGTVAGGKKAAKTNKEKYGDDWYQRIGSKGGKAITTKPKGFAANREAASRAGKWGGVKSKRGPATKPTPKPTPNKVQKTIVNKIYDALFKNGEADGNE